MTVPLGFMASSHTSAFDPSQIAGLKGWWKADALALSDGTAVSSWTDSSGNTNTMAQASGTSQPLLKTNILNGLSVVRFDGTDDFMQTAAPVSTVTDNFTMFAVSKRSTTTSSGNTVLFNGAGGSNGYGPAHITSGGSFKGALRGGVAWHNASTAIDTNWTIFCLRRASGTMKLWLNGGASVLSTASAPLTPTTTTRLCGYSGGGLVTQDTQEAMFYEAALSLTDMDRVGAYIAARTALTWSASS